MADKGQSGWLSSFFECLDPFGTCCLGCWCPCILYGRTQTRKENPSEPSSCNGSCGLFCGAMCLGLHPCLMAYTRSKTRERYNIDGSIVEDVLASWCCTLCVLTQEEKEVIEREKLLGSGTAAALQEPAGYQMQNGEQQGMKYEGPNGFA